MESIIRILSILKLTEVGSLEHKVNIILNPVRMRIIQYVARNQPATVAQIAKALPDVSKATVYRHMRVLTESGILQIVGEEKIRGTFEQSYSLNLGKVRASGQESASELRALVYSILTKLIEDFTNYFDKEPVAPVEDKVFISTNTLSLNDGEFDDFTQELFAVVEKYSRLPAKPGGKTRMITVVSSLALTEETGG